MRATKQSNSERTTQGATRTGPILCDADGLKQVYEWDNNDEGLKTALWTRQLATQLKPDPEIVKEFSHYCAPILEEVAKRVVQIIEPVDIHHEIRESHAWSAQKKKQYFKNSFTTLSRTTLWNKESDEHFYEAMVKVGEKNCVSTKWAEQFLYGMRKLGDRARLIFVPKGEAACGLLTMMQRPLLKSLKKILPGFCHSVSCTEMAEDIEKNLRRVKGGLNSLVALCADGSNHDGHQHMSLIRAVDCKFFDSLF